MAEDAAPFDNIDSETASLILQLQLADVQELRDRSKDKQRHGELTDDQVALSLLEQDLERVRCVISDRQMTQSIADAVRTDAEAIAGVVQEEEVACEDHTLAHRLNGSDVTSAVRLQSDALNEQVLARLAGQYISEDMGHELFDGTRAGRTRDSAETTQAESSAEAAHRGGRNPDPRRLQCVACSENKAYLDVIEVVCGHAYCIPCLQELIDLATKDETLFPPRCCKEPFNMSEVGLFLTKELRDQFDHAKVEFGTRDRTYCSETNCSAFILPDRIEQDTATCPKCLTATCVICKQGAHGGDCPDDPALRETLDLALQSGWQRCYACQRLIELEVGCNHMTCRCGAQFCYVCGRRWKECRCEQWNEDRLLARANVLVNRDVPNMPENNPLRLDRVMEVTNLLRNRHNCAHTGWRYIPGPHNCEECSHTLPNYIFECRQCRIQACNRCRRNRL